MTRSAFSAFLRRPSTTVLLAGMVAANRRLDTAVDQFVAQPHERVEATLRSSEFCGDERHRAQGLVDRAIEFGDVHGSQRREASPSVPPAFMSEIAGESSAGVRR